MTGTTGVILPMQFQFNLTEMIGNMVAIILMCWGVVTAVYYLDKAFYLRP